MHLVHAENATEVWTKRTFEERWSTSWIQEWHALCIDLFCVFSSPLFGTWPCSDQGLCGYLVCALTILILSVFCIISHFWVIENIHVWKWRFRTWHILASCIVVPLWITETFSQTLPMKPISPRSQRKVQKYKGFFGGKNDQMIYSSSYVGQNWSTTNDEEDKV